MSHRFKAAALATLLAACGLGHSALADDPKPDAASKKSDKPDLRRDVMALYAAR